MQNDNKNKSNNKNMAAKEDATDSTASKTKVIPTPTTIMAEMEDDTDPTATATTATATLFNASEWDDDIIATLENSTTLNGQIYIFGKRRWVKPDRKWRTPTPRANSRENAPTSTQQLMHYQRKLMVSSCLAAQQGK